jgi:hypothetical protein
MPIEGQPDFYPTTYPDGSSPPNPRFPWLRADAPFAPSFQGPRLPTVQVSRVVNGVPTAVTINASDYNPAVDTLWPA